MSPISQEDLSDDRIRSYVRILIIERKALVRQVEKLLKKKTESTMALTKLKVQVDMMMTLLKDLMDQAQFANNTFAFVNEYFNIMHLAKKTYHTM